MGIKNLKKFIREKFPNEIQNVHISKFYGHVLMMDVMSFIYRFKSTTKERWLQSMLQMMRMFRSYNVHVNVVMEGESPIEKSGEKAKRKQQRDLQQQRLQQLKQDLQDFESQKIVSDLLKQTWKEYKDNISNNQQVIRFLHFQNSSSDSNIDVDSLLQKSIEDGSFVKCIQEQIQKKEDQIVFVTQADFENVKVMCDSFGIPVWQSDNEAETMCCKMSDNVNFKQTSLGVISEDTDVLAYGCQMLICDLNASTGECNVIYLPSLLEAMSFTYQQFLHFCVMSGCDYNQNIPGISSVKCYEWISKYQCIDSIFEKEVLTIQKKINDFVTKKSKKESNNTKTNEIDNNEIENDDNEILTKEQIQTKMKRSLEMFSVEPIKQFLNSQLYWNRNTDTEKISEFFSKYHIFNENQFSLLWSDNKIKLQN